MKSVLILICKWAFTGALGIGLHEFTLWLFEESPEDITLPLYVMLVCTVIGMADMEHKINKLEKRLGEEHE